MNDYVLRLERLMVLFPTPCHLLARIRRWLRS